MLKNDTMEKYVADRTTHIRLEQYPVTFCGEELLPHEGGLTEENGHQSTCDGCQFYLGIWQGVLV